MDHGIPLNSTTYMWGFGIPISYFLLAGFFRAMNWWAAPARKGSRGSDIMAFQIVAGICLAYMAGFGVIVWFGLNPAWDMTELVTNKYYGHKPWVQEHLLTPMLCYQAWQILLCFLLNDLHDYAMIGHHTVTAGLAYVCMRPVLHYYVCFYFGLTEVTNIPLTIIDTFKYFPELGDRVPALREFCKYSFALLFYILRIFYWGYETFYMLASLVPKCLNGTAHHQGVVIFFLFAAAFLTGLQWLWGYKIALIVMKDTKKKSDANRNSKTK